MAAVAHACAPDATLTPVGFVLPASDARWLSGGTSHVTRDGLGDRVAQWWATGRERSAHRTTLVLNLDTGPEHHRRRTQGIQRRVELVQQ